MEIHYKILNKNKINEIDKILKDSYSKHEKVTFIFDLSEYKEKINLKLLIKIKPIIEKYENEGKDKLEKIYIVIPKKAQRNLINFFVKMFQSDKPVITVDKWPLS